MGDECSHHCAIPAPLQWSRGAPRLFILTGGRVSESKRFCNCPCFGVSSYCLILSFFFCCPTSEFHGKFHAKNQYRMNHKAMIAISVFQVKFIVKFTSKAMNFSWIACISKENSQANPQRAIKWKRKRAMLANKKTNCQKPANRNHTKIRNHRHTSLWCETLSLSAQGQKRFIFMYFVPLYLWERGHSHFDEFHWNMPAWLGTRISKKGQTLNKIYNKLPVGALH